MMKRTGKLIRRKVQKGHAMTVGREGSVRKLDLSQLCFSSNFYFLMSLSLSGPLYPKLSMCFEGTRLTQLVQLVTASRLFPCHEGRVDLSNR